MALSKQMVTQLADAHKHPSARKGVRVPIYESILQNTLIPITGLSLLSLTMHKHQ